MNSIKVTDALGAQHEYQVIGLGTVGLPYQSVVPSYDLANAINIINDTYAVDVSVWEKAKNLIKFGRSTNIGTSKGTLWYTGQDEDNETYPATDTNSIDTVSSSNVGDTEIVRVEGHTQTAGDRTFVVQTATLNGQNKVVLGTPLNRMSRIAHNDGSDVDLLGEIYGYEDTAIVSGKPSDTTKLHVTIPSGSNTSQKASTSLSSTDFWIIEGFSAGFLTKSGSNVAEVNLEVRTQGGVFKEVCKPIVISTGKEGNKSFTPFLIVPPNSDVRLTGIASAAGQELTGDIYGYLAEII